MSMDVNGGGGHRRNLKGCKTTTRWMMVNMLVTNPPSKPIHYDHSLSSWCYVFCIVLWDSLCNYSKWYMVVLAVEICLLFSILSIRSRRPPTNRSLWTQMDPNGSKCGKWSVQRLFSSGLYHGKEPVPIALLSCLDAGKRKRGDAEENCINEGVVTPILFVPSI
jgi:hypothetical protein